MSLTFADWCALCCAEQLTVLTNIFIFLLLRLFHSASAQKRMGKLFYHSTTMQKTVNFVYLSPGKSLTEYYRKVLMELNLSSFENGKQQANEEITLFQACVKIQCSEPSNEVRLHKP